MGLSYDTYGGEDRFIKVMVGNLREKDHLEDLGVDGRILSKPAAFTPHEIFLVLISVRG
jgi:hypothetical protein